MPNDPTQVAKIVLFMPNSQLKPAWIVIPLEIRTPEAITVLAGTITLTPGTVSCDLSQDGMPNLSDLANHARHLSRARTPGYTPVRDEQQNLFPSQKKYG